MAIDPSSLTPEQLEQYEKFLLLQQKLNDAKAKTIELLEEEKAQLKDDIKLAEDLAKVTGDYTTVKEQKIKLELQEQEIKVANLLATKKQTELDQDDLKFLAEASKNVDKLRESLDSLSKAKNAGTELASILGFDEKNKNSLVYRMISEPKTVFEGFKQEISLSSLGTNLLTKVINQSVEAFKQYAEVSTNINKLTGAAGTLNNLLSETARGATAFGVNFKQAGEAIGSLYNNLNTFTEASKAAQESLTVSVAKLTQLGISADVSATQIATLSQIMGISEQRAGKLTEEMAGLASAIGKSPQKVAQEFAAVSNSLQAYGSNMLDIFKDLEVQSKATGIAMERLVGVAEKFQTFEGAASAAGRLNAALGGNFVNSMELLEASAENPAKVIDLLRSRLDATGKSFDAMSFYEKKMIQEAAGFATIEEASRALSMTNAEREKTAKIEAERANLQEKVNDAIRKSIPIQQKLDLIMANFAILMGPVVDIFSDFLSLISAIVDNPIVSFLIRLTAIGFGLAAAFNPVTGTIAALAYALYSLHDILLKPHSPILFDTLSSLPSIMNNIGSSFGATSLEISKATDSLTKLNGSTLTTARTIQVEAMPNLKNMEDTTRSIATIDAEKTSNTMKVISNSINQNQTTVNQQPQKSEVNVFIGSEKLNQIVNRTVERKVTGTTIALPAATAASIPR